jgi:hypothetical protein
MLKGKFISAYINKVGIIILHNGIIILQNVCNTFTLHFVYYSTLDTLQLHYSTLYITVTLHYITLQLHYSTQYITVHYITLQLEQT